MRPPIPATMPLGAPLAVVLVALAAATPAAAQSVDPVVEADLPFVSEAREYDPRAVPVGDMDGDGHDDIAIIGAIQVAITEFESTARIFFGPLTAGRDVAEVGAPSARVVDDYYAYTDVTPAGDVNGDGRNDLLIHRGSTKFPYGVVVRFGAAGRESPQPGFAIEASQREPDGIRRRTLRAIPIGDADGDGRSDVAVESLGTDGAKRVHVVFGRAADTTVDVDDLGTGGYRILPRPGAPGALSGAAGDFTGDGRGDVVVDGLVVQGKDGSAPVDLGRPGTAIDLQLPSGTEDVAPAGDVDGDGRGDVAARTGGGHHALTGRARVVFGRPAPGPVSGFDVEGVSHSFSWVNDISGLGDLDGDGRDEFAVGDLVIRGRTATSPVSRRALGGAGFLSDPSFGADPWDWPPSAAPIVGVGDVIGDARPDVAFGLYLLATPPDHGAAAGCTVTGTPGPDVLTGTPGTDVLCGFGGSDRMRGLGGDDILVAGPGLDRLDGGDGGDRLLGGDGADVLLGGHGADHVGGSAGDDSIDAGPGEDRVSGGDGTDRITGGDEDDRLHGGPGRDRLRGGSGRDIAVGAAGGDSVAGGDGGDVVHGDGGAVTDLDGVDVVMGGFGDDEVVGGWRAGTVDGGNGNDGISSGAAKAVLLGGTGDDTMRTGARQRVRGGDGDDSIYHSGGGGVLDGGTGDDWLYARPGDPAAPGVKLVGGVGDDRLTGSDSTDVLAGGPGADELTGAGGRDVLSGGDGDDLLRSAGDGARDTDRCGIGGDAVFFDALDRVAADCEARNAMAARG